MCECFKIFTCFESFFLKRETRGTQVFTTEIEHKIMHGRVIVPIFLIVFIEMDAFFYFIENTICIVDFR